MSIAFTCPHCSGEIKVAANLAGRTGKCVHCAKAIVVPSPASVPPTVTAPAKPAVSWHQKIAVLTSALRVLAIVIGVMGVFSSVLTMTRGSGIAAGIALFCATLASLGLLCAAAALDLLVEISENTAPPNKT